MPSELQIKLQRLGAFLDQHRLDGLLLTRRDNFAWITCGRDNHIANNSPMGVASILATREGRICLASTIEAPRMKGEELVGTGIETIDFPWHDGARTSKIAGDIIANRAIATDGQTWGLPLRGLPGDFNELRWSLTDDEIARYRECGWRASRAMEKTCRQIKTGDSGHHISALLDYCIHDEELNPLVTLVAVDDQITRFRHPLPKSVKMQRHAMLVTCAERAGLIACLTRFVHVGQVSAELKAKQQAVCNIDTAVNLATRPGRTLGEIFDDLRRAYAHNGHADQWQLHHQGGSTGYNPRDVVATPGNAVRVVDNQAFAWNPSIVGAKSEDTVLVTSKGVEVLSAPSNEWPTLQGTSSSGTLRRADILVL
jgi:Xaa-Pro aminopeptidase